MRNTHYDKDSMCPAKLSYLLEKEKRRTKLDRDNKESHKDQMKAYRESHKDQIKEQKKAYNESHKDQMKAYRESHKDQMKAYRESHKDQIKDQKKAYYESHKDQMKAYRESHKDQCRANFKRYKQKLERTKDQRMKEIIENFFDDNAAEDIGGGKCMIGCAYCGTILKNENHALWTHVKNVHWSELNNVKKTFFTSFQRSVDLV